MKNISIAIKIICAIILLLALAVLYVFLTDDEGRDPTYDLKQGYSIVASNSQEWTLTHWMKERVKKSEIDSDYKLILEGNFDKYYSDNRVIVIHEKTENTYYCVQRDNEKL